MEPKPTTTSSSQAVILLISGVCCLPQMATLDQQAQQVIRQALDETDATAQIRTVTISSVAQGGVPAEIIKEIQDSIGPNNPLRLPALLINGKLVSFGVPELNQVKSALSLL
jgi:hypothetical protein